MSDRREPKWMRLSLERALLPQPEGYVYVMSRADGWHKIGVTGCDHYRKFGVSHNLPARLRPVVFIKSWPAYGPVYMAEKLAHERLVELGYERGVGDHQTEWFNVSEAVARKVVRAAVAYVASPENVQAVIKARAKRRSKNAWQREKAGLVVKGGKPGRKPSYWPSDDVEKAARKLWFSTKNIPTDAAAVRQIVDQWSDLVNEKGEPLVTERLVRSLGPSGRQKA